MQPKHRHYEGDERKHQEDGHIMMRFIGENNNKMEKQEMDNSYANLNGLFLVTDYSAIKSIARLFSNHEIIQSILYNQLSTEEQDMTINRIESSIGVLSNIATLLYNNKENYLGTFFPQSGEPFFSAHQLLDFTDMEAFDQQCAFIEQEWDIQEPSTSSIERVIKRERFTHWRKLLGMLYPKEENEELRATLLRRILYFNWILNHTISIMREVTNTEKSYREDAEKCNLLFNKQLERLQGEADRIIPQGHYSIDDPGWGKNPLIFALQVKNIKKQLPNLYHERSSDGSPITESQMLEYVIYKRLQDTSPGDGNVSKEMAERLTLVKDDPVKDQEIKQIINDLPKIITTLKQNEKGEYHVKGFIIASIIVLAGEHAKPTNIFKYFKSRYKTPSSFGNISTDISDIKAGKDPHAKPEKRNKYSRYKKLHHSLAEYYQEKRVASY